MLNNKKQNILIIPIAIAPLIGIIISIRTAIIKINFKAILNIKITNVESLSIILDIFEPWYSWSICCVFLAIVIMVLYDALKPKKSKEQSQSDELNLFLSLFQSVIIILIIQLALPLISLIFMVSLLILYIFFGGAFILQYVLRIIVQVFVWIIQNLFIAIGIDIVLGNFIGQEYVSLFLTLIIFLISVPYAFSGVLYMIKYLLIKLIRADGIIDMAFKPFEFLFKLSHVRYFIYFVLFLLSVLTYSYNISEYTNWLMIIKESLLAFVLLDTICYSVYDNHCKRKKVAIREKYLRLIVNYKLDLEFIHSMMTTYDLKNNYTGKAKIIFSTDISMLNIKERLPFNNIILQIQDLNGSLMRYEDLNKKINKVLCCIYKYESDD